jgi:predicted unusual protein kinase regulating ubiquinone biosynthesis (AarF/ABC1/UbiB family)
MGVLATKVSVATAANRAQYAVASADRRASLDEELQLRTAEQVTAALGNMKGALMKLGQLASFVDDGMPEPVRQALAQLQADAPAMSGALAAGVVAEELGAAPDVVFAEWDPVPLAAASIGQVHRARTADGRAVAVKVQYPGVDRAIAADLDNLDLMGLVGPLLYGGLDIEAMTQEIRERVLEELDYELEAENQRLFARFYDGHPNIRVPGVVDELSTRRVLTTELVDGARFDEVERWPQDERDLAAEALYRFAFSSIYRLHAFNGDPHPGNYLFAPGGRVHFLDFGLVKRFTQSDIDGLLALVHRAVVDRHPGSVLEACERVGFLVPGSPVTDEVAEDFTSLFFEMVSRHGERTITPEWASEVSRRFLTARATHAEVAQWGNIPAPYVILQRINLGLMSILGRLRATADWRAISEELWPDVAAGPSTPMGEADAAWLGTYHPGLVGPRASRPG